MSATSNQTTDGYSTLAIDGDVVAYRLSAAAEVPVNWHGDLWTLHTNFSEVVESVEGFIKHLQDKLEADKVVIALSDSLNFRKQLNPSYKAHRKSNRKPLVYEAIKDHMKTHMGAITMPRLEADDVLSIMATSCEFGKLVIASVDKDFKTVPGHFYDTGKMELKITTRAEAAHAHLVQTLTGDATDGYPGCPGMGPVSALKLLGEAHEGFKASNAWPLVVQAFLKKGLTEENALLQARMAYLLQKGDYNPTTNKITLWQPGNSSQPTNQ